MKKLLSVLLVALMFISVLPFAFAEDGTTYKVGDIIQFGTYPQTKVIDEQIIANLNALVPEWNDWISYGYYSSTSSLGQMGTMHVGDWMRYIDVEYEGEKYRGVKFTQYRPYYTIYQSSSSNSYQDDNGYNTNTTYWFKFEPLNWKILDPDTNLVICESIIDCQPYSNTIYYKSGSTTTYAYYNDASYSNYASDYETSSIRNWLNNNFYNTAFTDSEKNNIKATNLENKGYYTSIGTTGYTALDSNSTEDYVFMLSYNDSNNASYGFNNDDARRAKGSDYAKSQGLYVKSGTETYGGESYWHLRSAGDSSLKSTYIAVGGHSAFVSASSCEIGVRPVIVLGDSDNSDSEYQIRFYADMPSFTIKEGREVEACVRLLHNGEVVESGVDFSIVSSAPDIVLVENLSYDGTTLAFNLKAGKPGNATLTINEAVSETIQTAEIEVVTGNIIFNSQYLPTYYERKNAYNCYSSGLYVADFKSGLIDDHYNVTFDVYNMLSVMGAVCVYDANGEINSVIPVDRFEGNMSTSIRETFYNGYKLIDDIVWGDFATFESEGIATKTEINIIVPAGGYIEITNNPIKNKYCAAMNYIGFIVDVAATTADLVSVFGDYDSVTDKIGKNIFWQISETCPDLLEDFMKELAKNAGKKVGVHEINAYLTDLAQDGLDLLNESGLDIASIAEETIKEFGLDTAEKLFQGVAGSIGFATKVMFNYSKAINTTSWFIDLNKNRVEDSIKIWTIDLDGNFCDNGVKGNTTVESNELVEKNYIMRSIVVAENENGSLNFAEIFNNKVADNYIVRDIYFECGGAIAQPKTEIQVSIPVPNGYDPKMCEIYWIQEDGTVIEMNATYKNGYFTFATDHFSYYALVQKHSHSYTATITEPTCTTQGYTTYTCECGDSYVDDYTDKLDHKYTSEITTPATHLTEGIETFTCECGDSYTEPVAKLEGHTYTSEVTKEATHLEEGETTYTCECGDSYTEAIAKLTKHTYETVVTEPTCTSKGYTTYTCECGDSYIDDYTDKLDHKYTSEITTPATHLAEGIRIYTCSSCGDTYTENIAKTKEHSYFVSNVIAPTCEKEGYTVYSCECGDSYDGDKVSAKGHDYKGDTCKNCGETKVDNCSCNCHKSGFMGFIWKILRFFYKLFRINPVCGCGVAHY